MSKKRDTELIRAYQQGDQRAMEALWRKYSPWAMHCARVACNFNEMLAEDAQSEIYFGLAKALQNESVDHYPRALIKTIAIRKITDLIRREQRQMGTEVARASGFFSEDSAEGEPGESIFETKIAVDRGAPFAMGPGHYRGSGNNKGMGMPIENATGDAGGLENQLIADELEYSLRVFIEDLPERYRDAVAAVLYERGSIPVIAKRFDIPQRTLRRYVKNVREFAYGGSPRSAAYEENTRLKEEEERERFRRYAKRKIEEAQANYFEYTPGCDVPEYGPAFLEWMREATPEDINAFMGREMSPGFVKRASNKTKFDDELVGAREIDGKLSFSAEVNNEGL